MVGEVEGSPSGGFQPQSSSASRLIAGAFRFFALPRNDAC